ncbi:MAG: DUF1904 family protein [Negativicutes bacterium]|jgi:hypothetical protein
MPHLIFRGTKKVHVQAASKELPDLLAKIVDCPRDYFTFFHDPGEYFTDGKPATEFPIVQVLWFDRGQVVQNLFAQQLNEFLHGQDYEQVEIYFQKLEHASYYENGEHF